MCLWHWTWRKVKNRRGLNNMLCGEVMSPAYLMSIKRYSIYLIWFYKISLELMMHNFSIANLGYATLKNVYKLDFKFFLKFIFMNRTFYPNDWSHLFCYGKKYSFTDVIWTQSINVYLLALKFPKGIEMAEFHIWKYFLTFQVFPW